MLAVFAPTGPRTPEGYAAARAVADAKLAAIKALAKTDTRIGLHIGSKDMAHLVAAADVAIGAGGSSAWEQGFQNTDCFRRQQRPQLQLP